MALMAVAYAPAIIEDIRLLEEEYTNRLYSPLPFVVANFITGLVWLLAVALSFSLIVFWLTNFHNESHGFVTFTMWLFIDLLAAESMVVFVAALVPEFVTSLALVSFANGLWLAVGGFLVPKNILNSFWKCKSLLLHTKVKIASY
jgi:ABC-type multidrug transport system permease subunit